MTTDTVSAAGDAAGGEGTAAVLKVVRGQPSPEELAALVAVVMSRASAPGAEQTAPRKASGWTDRSRYMHAPATRSPGGWRASGFPH